MCNTHTHTHTHRQEYTLYKCARAIYTFLDRYVAPPNVLCNGLKKYFVEENIVKTRVRADYFSGQSGTFFSFIVPAGERFHFPFAGGGFSGGKVSQYIIMNYELKEYGIWNNEYGVNEP